MPGRPLADVRGFTLMEILIALATFLIVLFAVYTTFESSRATYAAGEQKADIQQNARIAMELIGADLRLIGYGYPSTTTVWDRIVGGCLPGQEVVIPAGITNSSATSITFWADLANASTTILNIDVNPGDTTLNVEDASGIQAGDTIYLINGSQSDRLTVQAVNTTPNPNTITTTAGPCLAYPWGSQVGRPTLISYCWYDNPELDGVAPPAACANLNPNTIYKDDGEGGGLQPVADVQNFQQGATLFVNQLQFFDATDIPTAILTNIRRLTVTLAVQSPPGWWRPQAFTMRSDIRPRNL